LVTVELQVANFAALREAKVSLNKLLVLMGPNSSGKSTAAVLLYAACRSVPWRHNSMISRRGYTAAEWVPVIDQQNASGATRDLLTLARESKTSARMVRNFPQSVRSLMIGSMGEILDTYVKALATELERCFGATLKELVRQPGDGRPMRIAVSHGDEWEVTISLAKGQATYEHSIHEVGDEYWQDLVQHFIRVHGSALRRLHGGDIEYEYVADYVMDSLHSLLGQLTKFYFRHFPRLAHYLPASRSGALQSHRALAAALIRQSTYAGIEDVAVPKLPGVVADFIGQLLELSPSRTGPYGKVADLLQGEVLHGEIELSSPASTAPEISFASAGAKHALHRTSSMVSELAPVVLFLRHVVGPRDLLIIEEPESHLHPYSQVNFATTLARLVSSDVYVAITTHSDYFINQISNLIMAAAISSTTEASDKPPMSTDVMIHSDAASAYLFDPRSDGGGSDVRSLPVTAKGISDEEFAQVADWLYNKTASLAQEVNAADA
jgi:predicted ATPase